MQKPNNYSKAVSQIHNQKEAALLMAEIDLLSDSLYKTGANSFENCLKQKVRAKTAESIQASLSQGEEKEQLLSSLKEAVAGLIPVKLTLAFEPSQKSLETISDWFKQNAESRAVIDYQVDPHLIAGVIVETRGKYLDLSYQEAVKAYLAYGRTKI